MCCLLQLTKCPTEHIRKASSLESIAAGSWEAEIDEVVQAAIRDASHREQHSVNPGSVPSVPPEDGLGFYSSDGLGLGLSGRVLPDFFFGRGCRSTANCGGIQSEVPMSPYFSLQSAASTPPGSSARNSCSRRAFAGISNIQAIALLHLPCTAPL